MRRLVFIPARVRRLFAQNIALVTRGSHLHCFEVILRSGPSADILGLIKQLGSHESLFLACGWRVAQHISLVVSLLLHELVDLALADFVVNGFKLDACVQRLPCQVILAL